MLFMYDQLDTPPPPPAAERRVRFAPFTEVYRDIPWARPTDLEVAPTESSLRESVSALRTEIKGDEALPLAGIVILVFCLFALFFLIWFVVRKVLLIEVDAEIDKHYAQQTIKFR
jgi:hypothetical protein